MEVFGEMTTEPTMFQQWDAGHDTNGNPRRCFVAWRADGSLYDAIDEGYSGRPSVLADLVDLGRVRVTPGQYREIIRESPSRGRYFGKQPN